VAKWKNVIDEDGIMAENKTEEYQELPQCFNGSAY